MRFAITILALIATMFLASCNKTICDNTCPFQADGECDDGGPESLYDVCQYGTDCDDCGEREKK